MNDTVAITNPSPRSWIVEIVHAVWHSKRVWLLHIIANAVLMLLAYLFLVLPDRTGLQVFGSAFVAALVILAALWLHGSTFAYFNDVHDSSCPTLLAPNSGAKGWGCWWKNFRAFPRRLPAALLWLLVIVAILWLWMRLDPWLYSISGLMRQKSTLLRKMFSPRSMDQIVHFKLFFVWAFILPITFLPLFAAISRRGFAGWAAHGWRAVLRAIKNWRWWLSYFILFHLAFWFPLRLAHWVPSASTLGGEFTSLILRFTLAYLLAITAWLLTISAVTHFTRQE
jgi:predicted ribosomally synthesized peptide with SipW-like signal peptide